MPRLRRTLAASPSSSRRVPRIIQRAASAFEPLEGRRLLCALHTYHDPTESTEVPLGYSAPDGGGADIIWTNRGVNSGGNNDGFQATFGANAAVARNVMDAVISSFERMIGDFNYSDSSENFNLTVRMSGNHNGASAGLNTGTILNGLPKSGTITMGKGSNGLGSGWFIDPTPLEHSEFMGNITNAFSGDAQPGSPASGLGDFFTVACAEMTHLLGLYGSVLPGWAAHTVNTFIPDTAEAGSGNTGSRGFFYIFQGPSIKHLLTSNNGGSGGSDWGSAIHGAGPGVPVNFGGDTYVGTQDIGNAVYEFSRRYIPSNTFALMFKDAYGFSTVNPAQFGTFYSILTPSNGQVLVRGGLNTSADTINISTNGSQLTVSVDLGFDVGGTGALPGTGNLPAFVTTYDLADVSSIVIQSGEGNDTINLNDIPAGVTVNVQASGGADTISVNSPAAGSNVVINAGGGTDVVNIIETVSAVQLEATSGADNLSVNSDGVGSAHASLVSAVTTLGSVTIGSGGRLALASGDKVLIANSISITGSGQLDLTDGALIWNYSGSSPIGTLQALLSSGYAGGAWNGDGINSSVAAADGDLRKSLGYAEATDLFTTFPSIFANQEIDADSLLVRQTIYGDATLDQHVNLSDYNMLAASYGTGTRWSQGNFNYDSTVNLSDYDLLAANFGLSDADASVLASLQTTPPAPSVKRSVRGVSTRAARG